MKLCIVVVCLVASVAADVSHLKQSGYVYNVPSPAFELPSPVKEYLPPPPPAPIQKEVIVPKPQYLPPVEIPAPIVPVPSYLPPTEPAPIIPEVIEEEPIEEPVKEYLPPAPIVPVAPTPEYLPPSVPAPVEYQSAAQTGGYRYDPPLNRFRF